MLRTALNKAYLKRTIRPLYGWTQATPKSAFLDPAWARGTPIWPGFVLKQTGGEIYSLANAAGDKGAGLSGLYIGGDGIDEPLEAGINAIAVWVLGPDAEFEILAPGFHANGGTFAPGGLVHFFSGAIDAANNKYPGALVPAGTTGASTAPVAKLIQAVDATKIVVGGLVGTVAY